MRTPEDVKNDKSVFMNQGEWELLHVLSKYNSFSLDNDDYYAEMKFHVGTALLLFLRPIRFSSRFMFGLCAFMKKEQFDQDSAATGPQ